MRLHSTQYLRDRRFERHVAQVHALGPRALAELLAELGADGLGMTRIEAILERYAAINPDHLAALGGDRFAPHPTLRVVGGQRHA